jgi:hypothetical protein
VIRIGLKPMTYCLEGNCSIQLSYRTESRKDNYYRLILLTKRNNKAYI